jgi:flagellar motor switch protein FliN/FliY
MTEADNQGTGLEPRVPEATIPGATTPEPNSSAYIQIWMDSFSQVITQITGGPVPCHVSPQAAAVSAPAEKAAAGPAAGSAAEGTAGDDQWIVITSAGAVRGEMRLRLSPSSVLRLGQAFMSEPAAPDSPLTADHRESVVELLRQVSGIVASAAKSRWGEVQLHIEAVAAAPSWPAAETWRLEAGVETPPSMVLEFGLSAALMAELRAEKPEPAKGAADKNKIESTPSSLPASPDPASEDSRTDTLDLLMDVRLAVSMRFGSRRLLLREVLDLSPGAVVELDRRIQEPVDLLLDGRLVARGEVVVIDGNYGLRVSEVSPQAAQIGRRDG